MNPCLAEKIADIIRDHGVTGQAPPRVVHVLADGETMSPEALALARLYDRAKPEQQHAAFEALDQ
jgi:hypothetical protein